MKKVTLEKVLHVLKTGENEVFVDIYNKFENLFMTAHKIALDISVSQELCSDNDPCK